LLPTSRFSLLASGFLLLASYFSFLASRFCFTGFSTEPHCFPIQFSFMPSVFLTAPIFLTASVRFAA
jgi:hypothetical protein